MRITQRRRSCTMGSIIASTKADYKLIVRLKLSRRSVDHIIEVELENAPIGDGDDAYHTVQIDIADFARLARALSDEVTTDKALSIALQKHFDGNTAALEQLMRAVIGKV